MFTINMDHIKPVGEFAELPRTDLGVPLFSRMSDIQKAELLTRYGVEIVSDETIASFKIGELLCL